jgi:NTP pyrophosphatase (non-canonical NTP hydrolase)
MRENMHLDEFQRIAQETDQKPGTDDAALIVPLLGLAGEAATLQTEFKKRLRDGDAHARFSEQVGEELGDVLWYVANIAHKVGLSLGDIAQKNLDKTRGRWLKNQASRALFDEGYPAHEQLPREFEYTFAYSTVGGVRKVVLLDSAGTQVGDPLTDNATKDDGYRFHDVLHLANAAVLGWSPVFRKLLKRKRKSVRKVDEVEDGGRAQVIDEAIAAAVYEYAERHNFLEGATRVDWELLRSIKRLTRGYEVGSCELAEWELAILTGLRVWRAIRQQDGGTVRGSLVKRTLEFTRSR